MTSGSALILISGFLMLLPFSTDLFQPALPLLPGYFDVPVSSVQLTMSLYAATFGICQLVLGPIADRYGRLPIARFAAGIYFIGTLVCLFAPTIAWLIGGRVMQAMGVCSGQICLRTMTRDLYQPEDGSHVLAKAALFMSLVPITAPILSGFLINIYGWRAAFVLLTLISSLMLVLVMLLMKETNHALNPKATRIAPMLSAYVEVLRNPTFLAYSLCGVLSYCGIFAFLSGSSFVFMRVLGVSPVSYGLIFSLSMTGNALGAVLCRKLIPRLHLHGTTLVAGIIAATSGCLQLAFAWSGTHHVLAIMVPMWCYAFSYSLNNPCFQVGAVAPFPEKAGSAAAVLGFLMMMAASLVGWWIGVSFDGSLLPLATTMCIIGLLLLANSLTLIRRYGRF